MTRLYRLSRTRWSDVGLVTLIIVGGSLCPLPLQRRPEFERFGPDTVLHFLGYVVLGATLADALAGEGVGPAQSGLLTVGSSAAIAIETGRLQRYVPGRAHERSDVVAGILGACVGVLWPSAAGESRIDGGECGSDSPGADGRREREVPRFPPRR